MFENLGRRDVPINAATANLLCLGPRFGQVHRHSSGLPKDSVLDSLIHLCFSLDSRTTSVTHFFAEVGGAYFDRAAHFIEA